MSVAEESQRGRTVPLPDGHWWFGKVRDAIRQRGMSQRTLAQEIGAREDAISRCLNNEVPTLDLINRISDFLEVPRPVFIAETEEEARGGSTTPSAADPPEVIIRKNMLRFREEAGYDLVHASDATEIPFDQLRSFEIGDAHPEAKHIAALAKAYGHKPGDFYELQPPKANLDDVPWIHFRVRPGFNLTEDDVAELMAVVRKIEQRFRTAKKKIAAEFQKAKGRRKPRGTDSP